MILWEANIPKDPDGIPSYVRHVHVQYARSWDEPAIFARVLKTFSPMESLTMSGAGPIPPLYELPGSAPFGKFGSELISLTLLGHSSTLATIMYFIIPPKPEWLVDRTRRNRIGRAALDPPGHIM